MEKQEQADSRPLQNERLKTKTYKSTEIVDVSSDDDLIFMGSKKVTCDIVEETVPANSAPVERSDNTSRGIIKERLIEGRRYHRALNTSIHSTDTTKTTSSSDTNINRISAIANNIASKLQEYNQDKNGVISFPYTFFLQNENAIKDTLNFEREFEKKNDLSVESFKGKIAQNETSRNTTQSDSIIPFSEFKDTNSQNSFDNSNEVTGSIARNSLYKFGKSNILEKSDEGINSNLKLQIFIRQDVQFNSSKQSNNNNIALDAHSDLDDSDDVFVTVPPKINKIHPNRNTAKRGRHFSRKEYFSRVTRGSITKHNNVATTRSLNKEPIFLNDSGNITSQVVLSSISNMKKQKVEPVVEIFVRNQKKLKKDSEQKSNSFENSNLTIPSDDDDIVIESSTTQQKTNSDKTRNQNNKEKATRIELSGSTSSSRNSSVSQFPIRRTRSNTKIIQSTRAIVSSFPLKKMKRKSLFMKPTNVESTDLSDYFNFPIKDELAFSQYCEKSDINRLSGDGFNHYLPTHDTKTPKDQRLKTNHGKDPLWQILESSSDSEQDPSSSDSNNRSNNDTRKKSFNKKNTRVTEPIDFRNMHQVIVLIEENPNILNLIN
ncbi:12032_t:CDS:10 [Ambispora gerdemannii]|uniref:12032_t:CDS:1 n=1 Tax=Ambispora gerdemannii TaxID=144530 RepID=A0A9N9BI96_9GLOM|nr:12032_t:CDS:10 [Ambispora gerdemannii]